MDADNKKIELMIEELGKALKFENYEDRIELKASFIQLDILEDIRKFMKDNNVSRTELAKKLNKSKSFVSQLFSGDKALNIKMIAQFQEIFNVKFVPVFKSYSELSNTVKFHKYDYTNNADYVKNSPVIFNIADYQEPKAA